MSERRARFYYWLRFISGICLLLCLLLPLVGSITSASKSTINAQFRINLPVKNTMSGVGFDEASIDLEGSIKTTYKNLENVNIGNEGIAPSLSLTDINDIQLHKGDDLSNPPLDLLGGEGQMLNCRVDFKQECFTLAPERNFFGLSLHGSLSIVNSQSNRRWALCPLAAPHDDESDIGSVVFIKELTNMTGESFNLAGTFQTVDLAPYGGRNTAFPQNEFVITPTSNIIENIEANSTSAYFGVPLFTDEFFDTPYEIMNPYYISWGTREAASKKDYDPSNFMQDNGRIEGRTANGVCTLTIGSPFEMLIESDDSSKLLFNNTQGSYELLGLSSDDHSLKSSSIELKEISSLKIHAFFRQDGDSIVAAEVDLQCEARNIKIDGSRKNGFIAVYWNSISGLFTSGVIPFIAATFLTLITIKLPYHRKRKKSNARGREGPTEHQES